MITVQKSEKRRHIENKERSTWITFDSENNADPLQDGFGVLKILNEEILSPGNGFVLHTTEGMIIITYVREGMIIYKGPLEKPDFLESKEFFQGNAASNTKQYAFNVSQSEDAHVFQCGFSLQGCKMVLNESGHVSNEVILAKPGVKKLFTHAERQGTLKLIASNDGRDSSLPIEQDVQMYSTYINKGNHIVHPLKEGRFAWLHVIKGEILMHNLHLLIGDGAGLSGERSISFTAKGPAEVLLFDLCAQVPENTKKIPEVKLQSAKTR